MNTQDTPPEEVKLTWLAHAISGWPLILVTLGGLLGGLCGGLAYGVSISIIKKKGPSAGTYVAAVVIGIMAVVLYFVAVLTIVGAFPDMLINN